MKVQLLAVGTKMPDWVQAGFTEYYRRLPKELAPTLVEISPGQRSKSGSAQAAKKSEAASIVKALPSQGKVVMMDVAGKQWSTPQLADKLADWQMQGEHLSFVIGGPDGIAADCLQQADELWSLSKLTLPHPLVRVLFIEQFYRAWTILQNHPYHK